jgi:hypothetical protein
LHIYIYVAFFQVRGRDRILRSGSIPTIAFDPSTDEIILIIDGRVVGSIPTRGLNLG